MMICTQEAVHMLGS
uniref:Uncharacterized protein n=1 Tax=Arundo donax TaxID=35708 RepID=A0A0A8YHB6_ARUDO